MQHLYDQYKIQKNGEASKVIHIKKDLDIKTKSLFESGTLTPGRKIQK